MRLLVIDNDKIFLDKLKKLLTLDNHKVSIATSEEEAFLKLDKTKFDLILTGLIKSSLSNINFINKLKEKSSNSTIILITDYATIETTLETFSEVIDDYILKPFEISTLRKKLSKLR